jgi:hypothetical protein
MNHPKIKQMLDVTIVWCNQEPKTLLALKLKIDTFRFEVPTRRLAKQLLGN